MRACVVGGAGYIGSHMVRALQRNGHEVVVFDDLSTGHRQAVDGIALIRGSILDREALDGVFAQWKPDVVFHFAALSIVADSVRDPSRYHRHNVTGSELLLSAMRGHGIGRIVFSSSAAVYGAPYSGPLREDHSLTPMNPYGATKLAVERMLMASAKEYGLRSASLRYFNAAGADTDGCIGEAHDPETHLVPNALRAAAGGPALRVFGGDYPTRDGTCVRDYVHVGDLADAHLRAAEYLFAHDGAHCFNLGSGRGCSVREIIDAITRVTGRPVPYELAPRREGDPAELVADIGRAGRMLGWTPSQSDVDTLIETAWRWHQRRHY